MTCRITLALAALPMQLIGALATGCHCPQGSDRMMTSVTSAQTNLIYNPQPDLETPVVAHESDWPSTFASTHLGEQTDYVEVIYDRQSTFWDNRDHYDRRFRSVRTGATRR